LECAAAQDVLEVCGALASENNTEANLLLDRIVAMLTKLGHRGYSVGEDLSEYGAHRTDSDTDTDSDPEGKSRT